jgi:hypothetical protein
MRNTRYSTRTYRRLAITMFRLLGISPAAALHDNIIGVFLPNLLGLTGGIAKRWSGDSSRATPASAKKRNRCYCVTVCQRPTSFNGCVPDKQ